MDFDPIVAARENWVAHGWADAADGMALVTSITRVQQIFQQRIDAELKPFGLTFARYEILMLLTFSRQGALPMGAIGRRLQVHPTSVTSAVDRLERDGMVEREAHPTDRRAKLCRITEDGRAVAKAATAVLNDAVFGDVGLPDSQVQGLTGTLGRLR